MLDEWGLAKIDEFRALKEDTKIYKIPDFLAIEQDFKAKTDSLLHGNYT